MEQELELSIFKLAQLTDPEYTKYKEECFNKFGETAFVKGILEQHHKGFLSSKGEQQGYRLARNGVVNLDILRIIQEEKEKSIQEFAEQKNEELRSQNSTLEFGFNGERFWISEEKGPYRHLVHLTPEEGKQFVELTHFFSRGGA